jgi:L-serine dehydratase
VVTSFSIFNDVLGPIMRGPSSSHTAGAHRIARICRALIGEDVASAQCTFDSDGSYAPTYEVLGVDKAFGAGLLGRDMADTRYESSIEEAANLGIDVSFAAKSLPQADHPNYVEIDLVSRSGRALSIHAKSPGGGSIEISEVAGWPVRIDGKAWDVVAFESTQVLDAVRDVIRSAVPDGSERAFEVRGDGAMLHWQSPRAVDAPSLEVSVAQIDGAVVAVLEPLFFVPVGASLFSSAEELLRLAGDRSCGLGEMAIAYEMALLDQTESEVLAEMKGRFDVMKRSIEEGLNSAAVAMPLTDPCASAVLSAERAGQVPLGGPQTRAAARALAVMHVCNSRGVVCAAPTGGSAGVLPGVLSVIEEDLGASEATMLRALFAASAIGLIVVTRATFAAETAGCQVEIGAAGAMAAAAVVEAAGGSAQQALDAASISLQNTMGSVCDPVGGGCEIPCHTRNAAAASSAFTTADLVMGGYVNPIPLDEAIDASLEVGMALPSELRCTARGGIAITPSAKMLCERRKARPLT